MEAFNRFLDVIAREIIDPIITLLAIIAFAVFIWGMAMFIKNADNEEKRGDGKRTMIWGVIGLAIIFGAMAIVNFMKSAVGYEG